MFVGRDPRSGPGYREGPRPPFGAAPESVNRSGTAAAHGFSVPQPPDAAALRQWAATLAGPVILPDDAAFDSSRVVWNRAIDRQPAAIARVADVEDVVRTLEFAR